jgi:hypothetical protein
VTDSETDRKPVAELQVAAMVLVMAPAWLHRAFVYEPTVRLPTLWPASMLDEQRRCSVAWQDDERLVAWCKAARVR